MPGKILPPIRDQNASDLSTWSVEVRRINRLLFEAETCFDTDIHHIQSVRVLLTTASELLEARAYAEGSRRVTDWVKPSQLLLILLCGALTPVIYSHFQPQVLLGSAIALAFWGGLISIFTYLHGKRRDRRCAHPATPVPAAEAILAETCAVGQGNEATRPSRQTGQLYLLLTGRQAGAMCTKLDTLEAPERVEAARFPNIFLRDVTDASHHLYAAMILLDSLLDVTRKIDEKRGRTPVTDPQ